MERLGMRLGVLLTEEDTEKLLRISRHQDEEPYTIVQECLRIMDKYLDKEDYER